MFGMFLKFISKVKHNRLSLFYKKIIYVLKMKEDDIQIHGRVDHKFF
jgi:hypothetical protein